MIGPSYLCDKCRRYTRRNKYYNICTNCQEEEVSEKNKREAGFYELLKIINRQQAEINNLKQEQATFTRRLEKYQEIVSQAIPHHGSLEIINKL